MGNCVGSNDPSGVIHGTFGRSRVRFALVLCIDAILILPDVGSVCPTISRQRSGVSIPTFVPSVPDRNPQNRQGLYQESRSPGDLV